MQIEKQLLTRPPNSMQQRQTLKAHSGLLCSCTQCCFSRCHSGRFAFGSNCGCWYGWRHISQWKALLNCPWDHNVCCHCCRHLQEQKARAVEDEATT
jgi:hypothetical protein